MHSILSPDGGNNPPAKVLIVDSEPHCVQEVAAALRQHGYRVIEATSFAEGKRLWMAERPHAMVIDIRLGQFNGLQLLMYARAVQPDISAVITCAFSDTVLEAETRRLGATFFVKPVASHQILAVIAASNGDLVRGAAVGDRREVHRHEAPRLQERRQIDRRVAIMPGFTPDRRFAERRALGA